jgi:formamidopyrimidine-DNA glycosylase
MPELPEVETTRLALAPYLLGQPLHSVNIRAPKLRQATPKASLLQGRTVQTLTRRAKYILAGLSDDHTLLIHLGMSGSFSIFRALQAPHTAAPLIRYTTNPQSAEPHKHDHAIFTTPLAEMRYNDPRRFGLLLRIPNAALATHPLLANLGPEPLSPAFTPHRLYAALQGKSTAIKPTLMDAKVVVGVGNIYASESLFAAHINPMLAANRLSLAQCKTLYAAVVDVLNHALQLGGSTLRDYQQPTGEAGHFQDEFKVYGRAGQACYTCGTPILQATQAQRSTFWCPYCQPSYQPAKPMKKSRNA